MKRKFELVSMLMVVFLIVGMSNSYAQRFNRGEGKRGMAARNMEQFEGRIHQALDLSEEQQAKLKALRLEHQQKMKYEHNKVGEDEARLKTLMSAPEKDLKAINKTIDKISEAKAELWKKKIAHQEEMKEILTPEQQSKMEQLKARRGMSKKGPRGMRQGFHRGQGKGPGMGNHPEHTRRNFHGKR